MVNTFIIYPYENNFSATAKALDKRRLFKQILEAQQIYNNLTTEEEEGKGYKNHPAKLMWKGYEKLLNNYINDMKAEYNKKGKKKLELTPYEKINKKDLPWWINLAHLIYSHRASLRRKDEFFYSFLEGTYPERYDLLGYFWPSKNDKNVELTIKEEYFSKINKDTHKNGKKGKQMFYTISSLKDILNEKGIKYSNNMKKKELFELVFPGEWVD